MNPKVNPFSSDPRRSGGDRVDRDRTMSSPAYPDRGMSSFTFYFLGIVTTLTIPCCIMLSLLVMTGFCTSKLQKVKTAISHKLWGKQPDPWAEEAVEVEGGEGGAGAPASPMRASSSSAGSGYGSVRASPRRSIMIGEGGER